MFSFAYGYIIPILHLNDYVCITAFPFKLLNVYTFSQLLSLPTVSVNVNRTLQAYLTYLFRSNISYRNQIQMEAICIIYRSF